MNPIDLSELIIKVGPTLKPPVSNSLLFKDNIKVMLVGGPNNRQDFHIEQGEELFYQMKGFLDIDVINNGNRERIRVNEGELFLLPVGLPHSPQRYTDTIGIVFERERLVNEIDCLRWYTEDTKPLYEEFFHCEDLGTQLKVIIDNFNSFMIKSDNSIAKINNNNNQNLYSDLLSKENFYFENLKPINLNDTIKTFLNDPDSREVIKRIYMSEFIMIIIKMSDEIIKISEETREMFVWQYSGNSFIQNIDYNNNYDFKSGEVVVVKNFETNINIAIEQKNQNDCVIIVFSKVW